MVLVKKRTYHMLCHISTEKKTRILTNIGIARTGTGLLCPYGCLVLGAQSTSFYLIASFPVSQTAMAAESFTGSSAKSELEFKPCSTTL